MFQTVIKLLANSYNSTKLSWQNKSTLLALWIWINTLEVCANWRARLAPRQLWLFGNGALPVRQIMCYLFFYTSVISSNYAYPLIKLQQSIVLIEYISQEHNIKKNSKAIFGFNLFQIQSLSSKFRLASYDLMSLACKRIIFWKESCSAFLACSVILSSFDSRVFILCTITWFCFWSCRSLSFVLFSFCCSFECSSLCNSLHGQFVRLLRKL